MPPDIYDMDNNSQVLSILSRNGFKLKNLEINQYIDL